jgi:hypothetical protein
VDEIGRHKPCKRRRLKKEICGKETQKWRKEWMSATKELEERKAYGEREKDHFRFHLSSLYLLSLPPPSSLCLPGYIHTYIQYVCTYMKKSRHPLRSLTSQLYWIYIM